MKLFISKKQNGVGLIEVLIATVVIAIGLLAVASLQGGFLSSSGGSKIRSEALTLAQQKIEELKNNINLAGYNAIPNSADIVADAANPIAGTNTSFTRSWVINEGGSADRKYISVTVSWDNDGDSDTVNDDEKINITTEMTFIDPAKTALYALASAGGTAAVPSPRQNASEDVNAASENVVGTNLSITDMDLDTDGAAGIDSQLQVDPDDSGTLITLSQVAPESHFYTATQSVFGTIEAGVIAVFLCTDAGTCSHIQNHFGGVVHRIKGTVYSTSSHGLSNIQVAWTSSDVHSCYVGSIDSSGSPASMPYECINAGNCNATIAGSRTASGEDAIIPGCFVDAVVSDAQINARNVGAGGEFGDVGLLGLDSQGGGQEQVCFLEDTTNPANSPLLNTSGSDILNESYLFSVTKRLYITRRIKRNDSDTINEFKSEGINRSYNNHNFFIINKGTGGSANEQCNSGSTTNSLQIAPREISRAFNEDTANSVDTETAYSAGTNTAHILSGSISGSATNLRLFIPEIGTCYLNNAQDRTNDATIYACVVASDVAEIDIIGSSNQHKTDSPSVFAKCTRNGSLIDSELELIDGNITYQVDHSCNWPSFTASFDDGGVAATGCTTPWSPFSVVAENATVTAHSTDDCSIEHTRTCTNAELTGESSAIYETSDSCDSAASAVSCPSPWLGGINIAHGTSVDTFSVTSVIYGNTCPSPVSVSCNDGVLSDGTSDITADSLFENCTVDAPFNCTTNWSSTVLDNESVTAYENPTVDFPATCVSETQSCTTGVLTPNNYNNASCSVINSTPITSWTGANPQTISWPAMTGVSEYKVFECISTNTNDLTPCTPQYSSIQTSTDFSPGDPGSKNTICINIVPTAGSIDGAASSTMCIHQKTGNYSYQ